LVCEYCGAQNIIEASQEKIVEIDFNDFINNKFASEEKIEVITVRCDACGASTSLKPNVTSDQCPFCGNSLVVSSGSSNSLLKPKSLLPFKIDRNQAMESFRTWIKKLWFAPSDLKSYANNADRLSGIYIPYWTYDSNTTSDYSGARGEYYYVTETYTETENGQQVTKTRQVKHTRWIPVSGHVSNNFDDILVVASKSLPEKYANRLEPWDLENLTNFNESFLSGFQTESYQVDVKDGFVKAKKIMDDEINTTVKKNIGGDEQRIYSINSKYNDITFKHILLPLWISAYRYSEKVYRFLVNARTGEVQGERPYSWIKIALFTLAILAVGAVVVYFATKK